jgi:hypothetical protein
VLLILTILAWQVRAIDAKTLLSESDAVTRAAHQLRGDGD